MIARGEHIDLGTFYIFRGDANYVGEEVPMEALELLMANGFTKADQLFGIGIAKNFIDKGEVVIFVFSEDQQVTWPDSFFPTGEEE